jgi:hypothetical protein
MNEKMKKRLEQAVKTGSTSTCPLCGKAFKSDTCPHSVADVENAVTGYAQLKILGMLP